MEKNYFVSLAKDKYARAIAKPTADALTEFCRQEPEFEQAIEQSGKTFDDCLTAITKGIGQAISDLEIYTRAVKFYFPVAAVKFHMTIDLCGACFASETAQFAKQTCDNGAVDPPITMTKQDKPEPMQLSLDSLLDF